MTATLDVVVPTLNAEAGLPATLAALAPFAPDLSVIVCDGGSADRTGEIAAAAGARVIASPPGRGTQLRAGAQAGQAPWLLFLHADTVLQAGWRDAVDAFRSRGDSARRAAYFRLRFDSDDPRARRLERIAAWRAAAIGLPYGDQGLLIARSLYERIGGFQPIPLMEDVDIVRRIGARNLARLDATALTSAHRYRRDGWLLRPLRNAGCLALYFLGVSPGTLRRLYER